MYKRSQLLATNIVKCYHSTHPHKRMGMESPFQHLFYIIKYKKTFPIRTLLMKLLHRKIFKIADMQ